MATFLATNRGKMPTNRGKTATMAEIEPTMEGIAITDLWKLTTLLGINITNQQKMLTNSWKELAVEKWLLIVEKMKAYYM
jgi:hypothetical protein